MNNRNDRLENDQGQLGLSDLTELNNILELAAELTGSDLVLLKSLDNHVIGMDLRLGSGIQLGTLEQFFSDLVLERKDTVIIPDLAAQFSSVEVYSEICALELRFFIGIPLYLNEEDQIGVVCLFGKQHRKFSGFERKMLNMLSRHIELIIETDSNRKKLLNEIQEKEATTDSLLKIAQLQSHQIRRPLTTMMGLVNLIKEGLHSVDDTWIKMFETSTEDFDKTIHMIVEGSIASKDLKAIRFNKMVEEIDDYAILILDQDGYVENWNKGAERIKGYRFDEIVGQHFSLFYTEEDQKRRRPQQLIKEAEERGVARDEGWRIKKGGGRFWGSIVITSIHGSNGQVIGFTKVTRDLTEITNVRDSLIASEELYNMMVEQTRSLARIGGWEFDVVRNLLSWTSTTKEIHGVAKNYIPELESAVNFYKEGESRNKISKAVQLAIENGKPWDLELQLVTHQGDEIWVRAIGRSNYKDGICTKVYGTFQDIDASKRN